MAPIRPKGQMALRTSMPVTFPHCVSQILPRHQLVQAGCLMEQEGYARRMEGRDREWSKTPLLLGILKVQEAASQGKIHLTAQELGNTVMSPG